MKTTVHQHKSDSSMLKPSKQKHKTSGKPNSRCSEKLSPVQPFPPFTESESPYTCKKIKLQLFPIDEATKNLLEQDKHNPYLELTLAKQKKISSVVKHLTNKWRGTSAHTNGEMTLFPYSAKPDNLIGITRWTSEDTATTAADVYAVLGNPPMFRLRYGWICGVERATNGSSSAHPPRDTHEENPLRRSGSISLLDSISNISFGAILRDMTPSQIPVTCDSFDAAVASLIARQQNNTGNDQPKITKISNINNNNNNNSSSIWDLDNTRHPFPVQNSVQFESNKVTAGLQLETEGHIGNKEIKEGLIITSQKEESNPLSKLDFVWPESSGLLENFAPCSRPVGSADSVGLSGLISNSLDAFQNFSIF